MYIYTCAPPGWGTSWGWSPWSGAPGGPIPTHDPFNVYCFGPCDEIGYINTYAEVALSGTYSVAVGDPLVISSDSTESTCTISTTVQQNYTFEITCTFKALPQVLDFAVDNRVFIGVAEDSGATVGLFFSAAGIGLGSAVGSSFSKLPNSQTLVEEDVPVTIRFAASKTTDTLFIYITKTADLVAGLGHVLRYVVPLPGVTSAIEQTHISLLGTGARPVQLEINSICLADGAVIPNMPPVADAGAVGECQLCTFGKLDGRSSYDPEGAALTYWWRLVDAPTGSMYLLEGLDGITYPEAIPTGYTNKLYTNIVLTAVGYGDVLAIGADALSIIGTGSDGHGAYIQVSGSVIADDLSGASFKVLLNDCFSDASLSTPVFYADVPGLFKFDLQVYDGEVYSERSSTAVYVRESPVPRGVTPDLSFMWGYLSDFWRLVEDRVVLTTIWSALSQIISAQLLLLWQVDFNKSLGTIQRTIQRRWLFYDLVIQEPFIELTSVKSFGTAPGYLSGIDGSKIATKVYEITTDLSSQDVEVGDFLVIDGIAYKIAKYNDPAHTTSGKNNVMLFSDPPAGIATWRIHKGCTSTQIDFWSGLVQAGDTAILELFADDGSIVHASADIAGVSPECPNVLCLNFTAPTAPTYAYISSVFRRTYVPINERIVDIPYLQRIIKDSPEEEILYRNVDYFLETFRDIPCLRFEDVWKHYEDLALVDDLTPPARLWAEVTHVENESVIEANFGYAVGLSVDEVRALPSHVDYLSAVRGIWYVLFHGPTLEDLRIGLQILFGLPFAEEDGTITDVQTTLLGPQSRVLVEYPGDPPTVRSYSFPKELDMDTVDGAQLKIGDSVTKFQPLTTGVTISDYISDPTWICRYLSAGRSEVEKFHTFVAKVDHSSYSLPAASIANRYLSQAKSTFNKVALVVGQELPDTDIDVADTLSMLVRLKIFDGACFFQTFGVSTMWDEPDTSPMVMSIPPDDGSVVYKNITTFGTPSGWKSAYDLPVNAYWEKNVPIGYDGPPNITVTPALLPTTVSQEVATITVESFMLSIVADGTPDIDDPSQKYIVAIMVDGIDTYLWYFDSMYHWAFDGVHYVYQPVRETFPPITLTPGSVLSVEIRPDAGCSNTPNWISTTVTLYRAAYSYYGTDIEWGFDRDLICPEETLAGYMICDWPGGVPTDADPLFHWLGDVFAASIVDGHIVLDPGTLISWNYVDPLAAGTYGRTLLDAPPVTPPT